MIAWLSIGILSGIALSAAMSEKFLLPSWWWLPTAALAIAAFLVHLRWMIVLVLLAGLLLGFWRGAIEQLCLRQYHQFYGSNILLQGTVSDDVSAGPGGDERLTLKEVIVDGQRLNGYVWMSVDSDQGIQRSDHVTAQGKLDFGFGSIAASMFHARVVKVLRPRPGDIGLHIRDWFAGGIRTAIPEPEASLASGYLVGQRSTLPSDLDTQLKTVGLTHAVVASGYNLTILVSLARQLLIGISKYLATLSAGAMIAGFIMISGLSPSMTRAGLVTSLTLAAWYYGRTIHPIVLLTCAAAVTATFNPFYVWGDIGWYLSFTSFAGVIIIAPLVQHALWRGKEQPGFIMQTILDTMSAQLATLPIMLFAFGHYSPYALLANLLVLPLVPLTMLLTFIAGAIGLLLPALAHIAGLPADLILRYMTWVTAHIANLPGAQGELTITVAVAALCYIVLGFAAFVLWRRMRYDFRRDGGSQRSLAD